MALLEVKQMVTQFRTDRGLARAVRNVSFSIKAGETVGLVGESGCGKSVTARSLMRLIPDPPGEISEGEILFDGKDVLKLSTRELRKLRGNKISMIFQDPMTSLNPVIRIGTQLEEVLKLHRPELSKKERYQICLDMMKRVKIPSPAQRLREYPHQLSGGMKQRVMIAMALSCRPSLLIADEPTTALDVTVQAQILELMQELKRDIGTAILLITHDLGVVAETCDRVLVMYLGQIVESGTVQEIFSNPKHPYTQGLLSSIPKLRQERLHKKLDTIEGIVPSLFEIPQGCSFQARCPFVTDDCRKGDIPLKEHGEGRSVRCLYPQGEDKS